MTKRGAYDDPVDDAEATTDTDTHVDDVSFERPSADAVPEPFPVEPTAAGAGTDGILDRPDGDSATGPWAPRVGPSFPRFRSLDVLRPDEQLVTTNREF